MSINIDKLNKPEFVLNKQQVSSVSNSIKSELENCVEFCFSVAFITKAGFSRLLMTLDKLNEMGIKGKIITADYLMFNKPEMFEQLCQIPNIELRCSNDPNFHPKGYIFKKQTQSGNVQYSVIIGSANLTEEGLIQNTEWNLKLPFENDNPLLKQILEEFNHQWNNGKVIDNEWIEIYKKAFDENQIHTPDITIDDEKRIEPNKMQKEALENLKQLRIQKQTKALLISATGTGKTFLSAFDAKQMGAKKVLFIAHREKLLNDAKKTFKFIFGDTRTYGLFTGNQKDHYEDFVFASVATLSKPENLKKFSPYEFDYVIIDEAHHSAANSYKGIIERFQPKFMLGMTATPNRMDNSDIYQYFDHNIAYEITLEKALDCDLLCPFRYYGIHDKYLISGENVRNDNVPLEELVNDKRVDYIMQKAKYYSCWNNAPQGLIFTKSLSEAKALSKKFNERGWRTVVLSGKDKEYVREQAIRDLEEQRIDYIITRDIFNEGVDIKCINQIIMLRPTESITIFVQQLGRGLRKYRNQFGEKDYLVVLDFIGNYNNNFMIPMALSGDRSYNKETLRRKMVEIEFYNSKTNIEFDRISQTRILESINKNTSRNLSNNFYDAYCELKKMLNKVPTHLDFAKYQTIDLKVIKSCKGYGTYLNFLDKNEPEYFKKMNLSSNDIKFLNMIFKEFVTSKFDYLTSVIQQICLNEFNGLNSSKYLYQFQVGYYHPSESKDYLDILESSTKISPLFEISLKNPNFKQLLLEMCEYNKLTYLKHFKSNDDFKVNQLYTRKDYSQIIGCKNDEKSTINGYKFFYQNQFESEERLPIFVNYKKQDDLDFSLQYDDCFVDRQTFVWESRPNLTKDSKSIKKIIFSLKSGLKPELFIRKTIEDKEPFYYLGRVDVDLNKIENVLVKDDETGKLVKKVRFEFKLHEPVKEIIYNYLIGLND